MPRPRFLEPAGGYTAEVVEHALLLVNETVPAYRIQGWSPMERMLVFDWAMREHLNASDSQISRRPKPAIVQLSREVSELATAVEELRASVAELSHAPQ